MYQHAQHKISILKSMPGLILASQHGSASDEMKESVFSKILEIIITFSNTGIINSDHELKPSADNNKIFESLISLLKKK